MLKKETGQMDAPDHEIVIIGAGIGGLGAAIALRRAGIVGFTILERAGDIGGTWRDNRYPDVATDVPGMSYQFSYEKNPHWSRIFPPGDEVLAYIRHCATRYQLWPHIRLNTEVLSRAWDEAHRFWRLELSDGDTLTSRYVISAQGPFTEPKLSDMPGLKNFAGKIVRTQNWDHDYDLAGKTVGIVGSGPTAVQVIPRLATMAAQLYVFQRRAIWVLPKPAHQIPLFWRRALIRFPCLFRFLYRTVSTLLGLAINVLTIKGVKLRWISLIPILVGRTYLWAVVRDRSLREKLRPDYAFGCKRPSMSNNYYQTFRKPNVELVTEAIAEIAENGVRTVGDREHGVDVLVLATGFELSNSLDAYRKYPVIGRDGFDLAEFYRDNRFRAYEGVCLPDLPNYFFLFGPYSWCGGSWYEMVETQSRIIVRVIAEAKRQRATVVSVKPEADERFFRYIRAQSARTLITSRWCASSDNSYLDSHGDPSWFRPTSAARAKRSAEIFPLDDFDYCA